MRFGLFPFGFPVDTFDHKIYEPYFHLIGLAVPIVVNFGQKQEFLWTISAKFSLPSFYFEFKEFGIARGVV